MTEQNTQLETPNIGMRKLCSYMAGSHAYGLSTPTSDVDIRGVFALLDVGAIIDPHQYNSGKGTKFQGSIEDKEDEGYYEFRHFLNILRQGNTNAIEILFNDDWEYCNSFFKRVVDNKTRLLDSVRIYESLKGYMGSELKLALGERLGKIGGKRRAQVEKHGFSPKNFVQLIRLAYCGEQFFKTGHFPLNLEGHQIRTLLMDIKTNPETFNKNVLIGITRTMEKVLDRAFAKRLQTFQYDQSFANQLMVDCYAELLQHSTSKRKKWYHFFR